MPASTLTDDRALRSQGLFLAEGRLVVSRVLASPEWRVRRVFLTRAAEEALAPVLAAIEPARRPQIDVMSGDALDEAGGFHFHQGCLAWVERQPSRAWTELLPLRPLVERIVILEAVRDPDNVGSIFRGALALGASAVLLGPGCADPYYRKTIRTSMAAVISVPFAPAAPWPEALVAARERGFEVVALTPAAEADALPDAAAELASRPVALVVGSEGDGLSADVRSRASRLVRVPMSAGVDSLNVATSTAIALYALTPR